MLIGGAITILAVMRPASSWLHQVTAAVGVVLTVAVVGRVAWELLKPLVGGLIVLLVLVGIVRLVIGRFRQW